MKGKVRRWKHDLTVEVWKKEQRSLLELTSILAEGSQAAAWLSRAAQVEPADAVKDPHEYEARMREILPRLFNAQTAAFRLSEALSWRIDPLIHDLITLHRELGDASKPR